MARTKTGFPAPTRPRLRAWVCAGLLLASLLPEARAIKVVDALSPRNRERPKRPATLYLLLHTTEAPAASSLAKLRSNGECHYLVDESGRIFRIIERTRVAYHAGLSMWEGRRSLDNYSIGIECVGQHDRRLTTAQYRTVTALVAELQRQYSIPDHRVIPHCMVAYGAANQWHSRPHRGRKRCGMQFATDSVRAKLGLTSKPSYDPDVRAGRLTNGDEYLAGVLFGRSAAALASATPGARPPPAAPAGRPPAPATASGGRLIGAGDSAWTIAGSAYQSASTVYAFPDGRRLRGSEIRDWGDVPVGTRVFIGAN